MRKEVQQFIDEMKKDKIVAKNLMDCTWLSGSSTVVYPITIWKNEIVFQWKSDKRVFDKFLERTVKKYSDLIEYGYFRKSDGSCPSVIGFVVKSNIS